MRNMIALTSLACFTLTALAISGCSGANDSSGTEQAADNAAALGGLGGHDALAGRELFENETFGGNGRTCGTCHTRESGTLSVEQIRALYRHDPQSPIFRPIDSDDGVGNSYTRLLKNGTIRITVDLPPNIRLHDNPTAKTFTVFRGTPTFINASLFPKLMWDGRESSLESQALGAVHAHTQNTFEPTANQLDLIADFERTQFTSEKVERYAHGGPAPVLPDGNTDSEKRGRAFFNPDGACGSCHDGPLLNVSNQFNPLGVQAPGLFNGVLAGFDEAMGLPQAPDAPNPVIQWDLDCPTNDGGFFCAVFCNIFGLGSVNNNVCTMWMPDPGEAIPTADPGNFLLFKTPSLWNVKNTAPYFHDNSAATLQDVVSHYDKFLHFLYGKGFTNSHDGLTPQEQTDLVNFMNLL